MSSTKLNHLHERTLRAYGSAGSYAVTSADVQAEGVAVLAVLDAARESAVSGQVVTVRR